MLSAGERSGACSVTRTSLARKIGGTMAEASAVEVVEKILARYDTDPNAYGSRASIKIATLRELLALAKATGPASDKEER